MCLVFYGSAWFAIDVFAGSAGFLDMDVEVCGILGCWISMLAEAAGFMNGWIS